MLSFREGCEGEDDPRIEHTKKARKRHQMDSSSIFQKTIYSLPKDSFEDVKSHYFLPEHFSSAFSRESTDHSHLGFLGNFSKLLVAVC
jgi:hypothetical protein